MATLRYGDLDRPAESLTEASPTTTAAADDGHCPACGGTNFSSVPHEEYHGKVKVLVAHRVCLGCRHLLD
jgi:hypothetical protein